MYFFYAYLKIRAIVLSGIVIGNAKTRSDATLNASSVLITFADKAYDRINILESKQFSER